MKSDLSNVKVGDKIWTIQEGWTKVIEITNNTEYPIQATNKDIYTINGKLYSDDKFPSAFTEYPFKEPEIKRDTLVYYRDSEDHCWAVGYYSHLENGKHFVFTGSKKSTETKKSLLWSIVTTENPFL